MTYFIDLEQIFQKFIWNHRKPHIGTLISRKKNREKQDGGIGRHTAPPRTNRTDRKSNGKEVQHQGNKK